MLMPMMYLVMMQLLLFTVIHVNFSQFAYSAEETDGEMTITLQADDISNWPYFVEINPTELLPIGAPGISSYILNCSWLLYIIHNLGHAEGNRTDFASDALIAVFNPGDSRVSVSMPVMMDQIFELTETLQFILKVPDEFSNTNGYLLVFPGPNKIAEGKIIDSNGT